MVDNPKRPFRDASLGIPPQTESKVPDPIRDKDNTSFVHKPPSWGIAGTARHAPRGATGTKRDLPTPKDQKSGRFEFKEAGDLKREFKPIASGHDKDRGWER